MLRTVFHNVDTRYMRVFTSVLFLLICLLSLSDAQENDPRTTLDEWRDTLQYGINSEILELLPTLAAGKEREPATEVIALFETTEEPAVLEAIASYLRALEIPDGHDRALSLLKHSRNLSDQLIRGLAGYLTETKASVDEETREELFRIVTDRVSAPAIAVVRLLASSSDTSSESLIDLYRTSDIADDVRGQILVELGSRGDAQVFEFISEIIDADEDATTMLQRYAIDTLGKLGDERALPILIRQFGSQDAMTRAYAVNALQNFDTPAAHDAMLVALRDDFWRVRVAALESIAAKQLTDANSAVMYKARRDPERQVRLSAIDTLVALDQREGWDLLEELVKQGNASIEIRSSILDHMIRNRPRESRDIILSVMETEWNIPNSRILDVIGRVVSQVEDSAVEPYVERLVSHPNYIIQIYGIRAIGRSGIRGLVEIVGERSTEGNNRTVRSTALRTLEQLGVNPGRFEDSEEGTAENEVPVDSQPGPSDEAMSD